MDEFETGQCATINEEELVDIRNGRQSTASKKVVKYSVNVLNEYAVKKGTNLAAIEQLLPVDLDNFLSRFYAELRKGDGTLYAKQSLVSLRYGLQQHFHTAIGTNILVDSSYKSSNEMFKAVLAKVKESGKDIVFNREPLSSEDLKKLYFSDTLTTSTPAGLQNKVFVDLMIHLCNSGGKNLRDFLRTDFKLDRDSEGHRYVSMIDKQTQNNSGDVSNESSQQARMYETPGSEKCPVSSFEKYMSKLNVDTLEFWQVPVKKKVSESSNWYMKAAVGINALYEKMKTLSSEAGLSREYTNYCLRKTRVTALYQNCSKARHFMNVSGRKLEASIREYSMHVADQKKREMSLTLSSHMSVIGDTDDYGQCPSEQHMLNQVSSTMSVIGDNDDYGECPLEESSEIEKEDYKTISTDTGEEEVEKDPVTPATAQGLAGSDYISNYQHRLTGNLYSFFKNNKFCDTVIDVQSKQQTSHKFYAHSVILAASNATLYEQLSSAVDSSLYMSNSLKPDIRFYIPIKDCDPVAVEISLRYIYTGQLVVPKSFSDETQCVQLVLAACRSLGLPQSMLHGVRLVVEDHGENAGSSTVELRCQSQGTALGLSDEDVEPDDHQLLDIKIECDSDTEDVHNSSSNDFERPASVLEDGVVQDCIGILKSAQRETGTSLDHVGSTAFMIGEQTVQSASTSSDKDLKEASEKTCEKPEAVPVTIFVFPSHHQSMLSQPVAMQISSSTSNSDAVVASVSRDRLYTQASWVKIAPKPPARQKVCNLCGAIFYSAIEHQRHLQDSHASVCQTRAFRVMSARNRKRHEATHRTTPRYSCQPCGLTFKTDILYRSHRMKFHGIDTTSFLCHICGATFTTSTKLIAHSRKHLRPYKCEKCGKGYGKKSHLNEHLLSCLTGEKPYMCDVCGDVFTSSSGLSVHLYSHQNGPAVCSECGKSYKHKRNLDLHLRECHDGGSAGLPAADKRCNFCGKAFVYKDTLDRHLLTHDMITGAIRKRGPQPRNGNISLKKVPRAGPHKCNICNRGFENTRTLASHMFVHREQKEFTCETCGKVLSDRRYLATHMAVHRKKTYSCSLCDKLFRQAWNRDVHMRAVHWDQDAETQIVDS